MPIKKKQASPVKASSTPKADPKQAPPKSDPLIVGIGASAGGLETLEAFFRSMPPDAGISFVIIQHLSPKHKSIMAALLAKHTRMAVQEIKDTTPIEPNCVYLNPPDKNVAIFKHVLHLMEPIKTGAINMPIDFFFRSLSEEQKEKAIAIVLSGTASDGTLGIRAVKGENGMAMVQDPATAKYAGMPKSAVDTGLIDFILPVQKMPEQLIRYIKHPTIKMPGKLANSKTTGQHQLNKIFSLIRSATGHDFSHYKHSTIERRIERRLAVQQIEKLSDYILFLQKNTAEIEILFKNLVIGVTSFFRDPKSYAVLADQVLEKLMAAKLPDDILRCWVVGCSTGEEAYSLAILLAEAMERLKKHLNVQIFATDIDEVAVEVARKGVYPAGITGDVSKERLNRFFIKEEGVFKIKKQIRDMIVFSLQSVIKDPPFSRLDLLSCRNLMIYLDATLQKRLIPLFHYTLNPEGILMLGTSESIGEFTDYFQPIDRKWKLFQRKGGLSIIDPPRRVTPQRSETVGSDPFPALPMREDIQALAEQALLHGYAPSAVLINDQYEILHFVGRTEKYLVPPTGKPRFNILSMARQDLKYKLMTVLNTAFRDKTRITHKGLRMKRNGSETVVDISVAPLMEKGDFPGLMLVVFEDKTPEHIPGGTLNQKPQSKRHASEMQQLEQELLSTREYLQATIEELETANEELKSTNEEMQSVNEELQSTNEELETSKEELQSTNEEMSTVNSELQRKVDELSKSSNDMNNLLAATEIASIFLDTRLCIKRYTPAAAGIIKLIQTDIGRPLGDLKTSFPGVDLAVQARGVLKDLNTINAEVLSEESIWYALKMMPYRTIENVIEGVVITFINIHEVKKADIVRRMAIVLEDANDAIVVLDFQGWIKAWNKGAAAMYGYSGSEALQMNFAALIPEDRPDEIEKMAARLKKGEIIKSHKSRRKTQAGDILDVWLTATALADESGQPVEMAITERDLAWLSEK